MIQLENAKKNYGSYQFEMSMEIPKGRITGLVGKNGAGKSTAIKLMLGLIRPDAGRVRVFGTDAADMKPSEKSRMGVSLAESGFSREFTVSDVERVLSKLYDTFQKEYFERKCQELNLPENKKLKDFSTGMRAKLRVLVAMTHGAELLIMDEPTAGLDVEARNEILDMLREYAAEDEDRTILITSHISTDLENLCDDIYLIHEGKMILHEETDAVLEQYGILKVSKEQYEKLDKRYLLKNQEQDYGYACFTKERQYYQENYPEIVVEKGGIDDLILMMTGGYR